MSPAQRRAPTFLNLVATRGWLAAALILLLGACAPLHQSLGPPTTAPQLTEDEAVMADGARLPIRQWLPNGDPPRAVLLALHGFNDYSNAFDGPGEHWATEGIATYAYDQRGFGAAPAPGIWPGIDALTSDLRTVVALLRERHPNTPLFLLGDSMGGAVLLSAADDTLADGTVLVAPAVRGRETLNPIYRAGLWLGAHLFPSNEVTGRGLGIVPSDNIEMIRALRRDPLVIKRTRVDAVWGLVNLMDAALQGASRMQGPVLLTYGARDELIPKEPTRVLLTRFGTSARVAVYSDGYHMLLRDLSAAEPLTDIAAWVLAPDDALPSNAEQNAEQFFEGWGEVESAALAAD